MGKYEQALALSRRNMTPSQIRANKCERTKARNSARSEERQAQDEARPKRTPEEQLAVLDTRPGKAVKERTRLLKAIAERDTTEQPVVKQKKKKRRNRNK